MSITNILIRWYESNRRSLPWRGVHDPYLIWVSEVILQQTRVAQGQDYYLRFTRRFPDVSSLAAATEDEVLHLWQGLGYYSRARNMHEAARTVVERFGGEFPTSYEDIRSLKGIGDYTAAAIVSLAWNEPYPVVDGNVFRVLSRLFAQSTPIDTAKGKKVYTALAASLMPPGRAGLYNQAIMEFGALHCLPQNPLCPDCPLQGKCLGYASGSPQLYPVKQNKTKTRNRYFHFLHILYKERTWLNRREGKDIWQGLYEFPLMETDAPAGLEALCQTEAFRELFAGAGRINLSVGLEGIKHILSHQVLYASFYKVEIEQPTDALRRYLEIPSETIGDYAVPRLMELYLENSITNYET